MKILYAIQGTGNGHLARAMEIIPVLNKIAETDILVSGIQGDLQLPFEIKYRLYGMSFIFGTKGGVNILKTIQKMKLIRLIRDILKLPVHDYDVVLCDFEPVSAWACKLKGKRCIGVSHQNAVLHPGAPKPKNTDWMGKWILKNYAPSDIKYGFHFKQLDEFNFTPVIRPAIQQANPENWGHYTVYLPSFSNREIENVLLKFPDVQWQVFSKHSKETYQMGNISFQPVSLVGFNKSFINCEGILCNAGFETPSEAIFMGKKLCVIPMKGQYEQQCNAAFLDKMGVMVLSRLDKMNLVRLNYWLESNNKLQIKYPNMVKEIIGMIILKERHMEMDKPKRRTRKASATISMKSARLKNQEDIVPVES